MTRPIRSVLLASAVFFILAICAVTGRADELMLENGDVITGKLTRLESGTLTFTTDYSEPVTVRTSKVRKITTDSMVEVHLSGGEVLKGTLSTIEPGRIQVQSSEGRGVAEISWDKVESLNPPRVKWTGNLTVGANTQSGNTDRMSASVGAEAEKKTENDRASFKLLYNYAEESDVLSARNIYGTLKYDYFFTKKYYGYLSVEMLSDEFRDIKLRSIVGPGLGYQVWDDGVRSLLVELGAAYFSEDLDAGADDSWATSRAAASLAWKISGNLGFSDDIVVHNRFEDPGDYQARNEAALNTSLGAGWAMKLSNIIEYDSDPPVAVENTDMFWILGLQYSF